MATLSAQIVPESEIYGILTRLFQDEQDSVKMHLMESCVSFAKRLNQTKLEQYNILPMVNQFAQDRSWRIRYTVTDSVVELIRQG